MLEDTMIEKKGIRLNVNFDKTDSSSYRQISEITRVGDGQSEGR